jgi:phosphate transport system substrate-binding protein
MSFRNSISFITCVTALTAALALSAANIEITDGSVIVGDIIERYSQYYSIRMKNGAQIEIRTCDVVRVLDQGNEITLEHSDDSTTLRFSGSNTMGAKLVPKMAESYVKTIGMHTTHWSSEKENERVLTIENAEGCTPRKIDIRAHGSSTAFRDLASGQTDIGMSSRPINHEEALTLASQGDLTAPVAEKVLALDGIAIVIHPDNPVNSLSTDTIAKIFSGKITDWSDAGGNPGPIHLFSRDGKSGTYDTFNALVLKRHGGVLASSTRRLESSTELSDSVASDPFSIGFIGLAYIRNSKPLAINECDLHYKPTYFNVKTEEYPLSRRLFLYAPTTTQSRLVKDFIQFATSDDNRQVINDSGFIDLSIETNTAVAPEHMQLTRLKTAMVHTQDVMVLKDYMDTTSGAERLSVTFRFKSGSSKLDNRALYDIKRLTTYMKEGEGKGKQLMLLGFSDMNGEYGKNLSLSHARARSVARQLAWSGVRGILSKGFSEEAPVACNNDLTGFRKNRRVEAWIK